MEVILVGALSKTFFQEKEEEIFKTVQSLLPYARKGFRMEFQEVPPASPFFLYPGETIQKDDHTRKESPVYFGNWVAWQARQAPFSLKITASSSTPIPERIQKAQTARDEEDFQALIRGDPEAAEGYYLLGRHYESKSRWVDAMKAYLQGIERRPFRGDIYLETCHAFDLDFHAGIVGYYAGEKEKGGFYTDRTILQKDIPYAIRVLAMKNYEFYMKKIESVWTKTLEVDFEGEIEGYSSMNPSILPRQEGGYWLWIRTVNWHLNPVGFNQYITPDPNGKLRTKNLLSIIDSKGNYLQKPVKIEKRGWKYPKVRKEPRISGLEDGRLYRQETDPAGNTKLFFSCVCYDNHPGGRARLSLGTVELEASCFLPRYTSLLPLTGFQDENDQKNWLLYRSFSGPTRAIYGYQPLTMIEIEETTAKVTPLWESLLPIDSGQFRGSAGPLAWEDGYLVVTHQVYLKDHQGRRYTHRFLFLDSEFILLALSAPWYFQNDNIEYVAGMALGPDRKTVWLTYSIGDAKAYLSAIASSTIRTRLRPISDFI